MDRWWDSGSAGCEYGINAVVFRDGKTKSQYFKYRDAYSSSGDAWHLRFKTAEIEKIHKTNLTVKLKSNDYEYSVSFDLAQKKQKKVKPSLDKKAQKEYLKHFEEEKVRLLKQHYKENALMADYISMWGVEGVTFSRGAGPSGRLVPYQESTIADEVVRADQGIGVVIVKAQIDHSASRGKQFEWVAYKITPQKTESLSRDCAYQYDMKHGKKIDMKASEMLLQYLN